ncbi:MAG: hypothetical protein QOF10_3445 [Kribbellaceae bacterium]|jgi:hypothetical protein|nr:hypothetical protein [Kribbellaceae bacterium]
MTAGFHEGELSVRQRAGVVHDAARLEGRSGRRVRFHPTRSVLIQEG